MAALDELQRVQSIQLCWTSAVYF